MTDKSAAGGKQLKLTSPCPSGDNLGTNKQHKPHSIDSMHLNSFQWRFPKTILLTKTTVTWLPKHWIHVCFSFENLDAFFACLQALSHETRLLVDKTLQQFRAHKVWLYVTYHWCMPNRHTIKISWPKSRGRAMSNLLSWSMRKTVYLRSLSKANRQKTCL